MNQTTFSGTETVVNGITLSRAALVQSEPIPAPGNPEGAVRPGPMLTIRVPPAMLHAARHSGLFTTSAVLLDQSAALALLWLHAGRCVSVILADLGDAEMQHYAADAVAVGVLRIALLTDRDTAVTASPLPTPLRRVLVEPAQRTPAQLAVLAGAVSYAMQLLSDDQFLQSLHIDARRIKGKSLHLHLGPEAGAAWHCNGPAPTPMFH
jgi:hypothetical protein